MSDTPTKDFLHIAKETDSEEAIRCVGGLADVDEMTSVVTYVSIDTCSLYLDIFDFLVPITSSYTANLEN